MKILLYAKEDKLKPIGGMTGYCYNILQEKLKKNDNKIEFIKESIFTRTGRKITIFYNNFVLSRRYGNCSQSDLNMIELINDTKRRSNRKSKIDFSKYDIVHFHSTYQLYSEKKQLEAYKGIVLLTTHSPKVSFKEKIEDYTSYETYVENKELFDTAEEFDIYAFERADFIIFPCMGAEEPYYHSWPIYEKIRNESKIKYIPTGIIPVQSKKTRKQIREELCIPEDSIVLSYVGRHNKVKGYDILQELFKNFEDIYVVCCGNIGAIQPPENKRWIEVGWTTDPYSYVNASDIYMLPNRETYFDIAMLQTLSIGKCSVISNTGGNREFADTPGVKLYNNIDEAIECIKVLINMDRSDRIKLENQQREEFEKKYRIDVFYDKYIETLTELIKDKEKNDNK